MKLLITGGSHVASLRDGWQLLREAGAAPSDVEVDFVPLGGRLAGSGRFFERRGDGIVVTNERFRLRIARFSRQDTPYDAIGLSTPFHSRGVWLATEWSTHALHPAPEGRQTVSRALLRRAVRDHNGQLVEFLALLREIGFDAFAIEGPKPFRHNPEIALAGHATVRAIDAEYHRTTLENLRERGIAAVCVPAQTCDADGCTLDAYRHERPNDTHHANAAHGALLMREVLAYAAGARRRAAA